MDILANGLKFNTSIKELEIPGKKYSNANLIENKLGDEAATTLADMLKTNSTLRLIYLDGNIFHMIFF